MCEEGPCITSRRLCGTVVSFLIRFLVCSKAVDYSLASPHRTWRLHHGVLPDEVVSGCVSVFLWKSLLRHETRVSSVTSFPGPGCLETLS